MADVRKQFIFSLISCYHGKFDENKFVDDKHLNDFLEDTNCLLLVACLDSSNDLHLTSKVSQSVVYYFNCVLVSCR